MTDRLEKAKACCPLDRPVNDPPRGAKQGAGATDVIVGGAEIIMGSGQKRKDAPIAKTGGTAAMKTAAGNDLKAR